MGYYMLNLAHVKASDTVVSYLQRISTDNAELVSNYGPSSGIGLSALDTNKIASDIRRDMKAHKEMFGTPLVICTNSKKLVGNWESYMKSKPHGVRGGSVPEYVKTFDGFFSTLQGIPTKVSMTYVPKLQTNLPVVKHNSWSTSGVDIFDDQLN